MQFDKNNKVFQLCAVGMEYEGRGKPADASDCFSRAWDIADTDIEKLTAAHYLARHQPDIAAKLVWDKEALKYALRAKEETVRAFLPSLCLNVGKCYEDLGDLQNAQSNYQQALAFVDFLPADGYGIMIRKGVYNALERLYNLSGQPQNGSLTY